VEPKSKPAAQSEATKAKRKQLFTRLALGIAAVAVAYGAYDVLFASNHVETDNAYVGADTAQITAQVVAPVREVLVSDTQMVKKATFWSALTTQMLGLRWPRPRPIWRRPSAGCAACRPPTWPWRPDCRTRRRSGPRHRQPDRGPRRCGKGRG
jgi:hypothetical protein